jgi:arylsulfatase A-like enzyme
MNKQLNNETSKRQYYIRYVSLTIVASYIYVFMEWVFFITKPSFMDFMSVGEKLNILFGSGFFVAALAFVLLSLFMVVDFILMNRIHAPIQLSALPVIFILGSLGLLLIDNFTYTVFRFGIIATTYKTRLLYILIYSGLLYYFYTRILIYICSVKKENINNDKKLLVFCLVLIGISLLFSLLAFGRDPILISNNFANFNSIRKPNIIILGTDGIEASHMSVYGYERDTTPIIAELAKRSLVAENHFTNACCTLGSIISTLTGKLPIETHTLTSPDILQKKDSYQHLVYLLKQEGYSTIQMGESLYVNANRWNMLSGFDMINGNNQNEWSAAPSGYIGNNTNYFISEMKKRLFERILHIFYIKDMEKPITSKKQPAASSQDPQKVARIMDLINTSKDPFFVHVHLLNTHGPKYRIDKQIFSAGDQSENWMPDFMDDAIWQYDQYVKSILNALEETGQIDNTILIIYTDHGSGGRTSERIPLIIHFPEDEYAGKISANTQNLDIAPTVLDYMNLPQPDWMKGVTLLKPVDKRRLIFNFSVAGASLLENRSAPFYQFGSIRVIECQRWYSLDLIKDVWQSGDIRGHTAPCIEGELESLGEIQDATLKLLSNNNFDISSLKLP